MALKCTIYEYGGEGTCICIIFYPKKKKKKKVDKNDCTLKYITFSYAKYYVIRYTKK